MTCENKRLLFPKVQLIKKEVRERFLYITRFIYQHHQTYTYQENESQTAICIQDAHGFSERDGKLVKIISKVGSYTFQLNDTLRNNFSSEVYKGENVIGTRSQFILTVPLTVTIQSYSEEESSDVADELVQLVLQLCRNYYSQQGLIPRSGHVSETDEVNRDQNIFQTSISFVFDVPWSTTVTAEDDIIDNIFIELEPPTPIELTSGYRAPGVHIIPAKDAALTIQTYAGQTINVFDD